MLYYSVNTGELVVSRRPYNERFSCVSARVVQRLINALFGHFLLVLDNEFDQPAAIPLFWQTRVDNCAIPDASGVVTEATVKCENSVIVTNYSK